jgi:L-cysteine/cystine lyase
VSAPSVPTLPTAITVPTAAIALTAAEKRQLLASLLLARHRKLFATLDHKTYLNFGAQGLLSANGLEAMRLFYEAQGVAGPMSIESGMTGFEELRRTRLALASELGATAADIAQTDNTSIACNIVLWGLDWRRGEHLILGDHEYPGVVAAAGLAAARLGLEVSLLPTDVAPDRLLEGLANRLRPESRLVVLSHVLWDTGRVLPIAAILALCREPQRRQVRVLVDGAQSAGAMPLDLAALGADFYAFPGQKWFCGPEGTGGLYIDPQAAAALTPIFIGPRSLRYDAAQGGLRGFHSDARRFEIGTFPIALCAGLRAALELRNAWGDEDARWRRILQLSLYLWTRLGELDPSLLERLQPLPPETGLVFFRFHGRLLREDFDEVTEQDGLVHSLESHGILVRTMPHLSCIRVSIHYFTLESSLEKLIGEMQRYSALPLRRSA